MFQKIGFTEIAAILVIAFLIFGPAKLPQLGKSVGESIKEFKKAFRSINDDETQQNVKADKD